MWATIIPIAASMLMQQMQKGKESGQEEFSAIDRALDRSGARRDAIPTPAPFMQNSKDALAEKVDTEGIRKVLDELYKSTGVDPRTFATQVRGQVDPMLLKVMSDEDDEDDDSGDLAAEEYEDLGFGGGTDAKGYGIDELNFFNDLDNVL